MTLTVDLHWTQAQASAMKHKRRSGPSPSIHVIGCQDRLANRERHDRALARITSGGGGSTGPQLANLLWGKGVSKSSHHTIHMIHMIHMIMLGVLGTCMM